MPEQATQSTLEGNFKVIELLCYHSKCVPISRACREGTCLTPGLKTEHLVNKCIIIWPRERKAVLKFGVQHLANSFPACAPPWWHLVQHMDSFPNLTTRDNLKTQKSWKSHVSTSLPKYKFIIQSQMQVIPSGQIWERIHVLYKVPPGGSTGREGIC